MASPSFKPDPYAPGFPEPARGGCGSAGLGCALVFTTIVVIIALVAYLAFPGFVAFTVQHNLVTQIEAVEKSNLDQPTRDEIAAELSKIRLSLDDHVNFGFFQAVEINQAVDKLVLDRRIDPAELAKLRVEIGRMKKIQGIDAN